MEKGISLYIAILIMSILLALVLGMTAISFGQLRIVRGIENSVIAFHAADTGIERVLKKIIYDSDEINLTSPYSDTFANGADYQTDVLCCSSLNVSCNFYDPGEDCPAGLSEAPACPASDCCSASRYCIRSEGNFNKTKRAIEATYGAASLMRFEFLDAGETDDANVTLSVWKAQTFTVGNVGPPVAHRVQKIELLLSKMGAPAGLLFASIQGVDGLGLPNGLNLCAGFIPVASIGAAAAWHRINIIGGCILTPGTQYAIVLMAPGADMANPILWWFNDEAGTYGGGTAKTYAFGAWSSEDNDDFMFEVWGYPQ